MNEVIVILGVVLAYYAALLTLRIAQAIVGTIDKICCMRRKL